MNFWIVVPVVAALVALRFLRPHLLAWTAAWWLAFFLILSFGMRPPLPSSIVGMFMAILTAALALYLTVDSEKLRSSADLMARFFTERRFAPFLWTLAAIIPLIIGVGAWRDATREAEAPASGRTIHPAPPGEMSFRGKRIDLIKASNPFRELETKDPAAFASHVASGREVYYRNCVFCHGDNMGGDGLFAHGFDPLPANFQDATTIAMLQESYLFWRIAKGGPGLPDESTPWSSAMPAWEPMLNEDQTWDVILFLYHFTGQKPRSQEKSE